MTNKQLLEYAAKAAGIELLFDEDGRSYFRYPDDRQYWNSLNGDGDALRLAVKLEMELELFGGCSIALMAFADWVDHNNDPYAATRRAITQAAAEIGKGME